MLFEQKQISQKCFEIQKKYLNRCKYEKKKSKRRRVTLLTMIKKKKDNTEMSQLELSQEGHKLS